MSGDMKDEMGTGMGDFLPPACAAISDDLAELALGTLTGRERVVALSHLESCARCSAEVEELSAAADQLLHLAPSAEPPVGFEAGVFERLGLQDKPRRWRPSFNGRSGRGGLIRGGPRWPLPSPLAHWSWFSAWVLLSAMSRAAEKTTGPQ